MRVAALSLVVLATSVACSATTARNVFTSAASTSTSGAGTGSSGAGGAPSNGSSTGATGEGGGLGIGGSFAGAGGGTPSCSSAAELVYVFDTKNNIYSFNPPTKQFTKIVQPDCNADGMPNSMAIDRNLVAWINYVGGIYTFDLNTKSGCTQAVTLGHGFKQIGMGFSSNTANGAAETLFIDGTSGGGLAQVVNSSVMTIGDFSNDSNLTGQSCELTGTGDAQLFGYFTTSPYVRVAQIDKTNGSILSDFELSSVEPPDAWAFSFWGGDFYLYAATGSDDSSVIHYSPSTKTVDPNYISDVGFQIIGAGVSTCAPLVPPQ